VRHIGCADGPAESARTNAMAQRLGATILIISGRIIHGIQRSLVEIIFISFDQT
jgi:hypothetical protein